ncbi:MAG: carboxypeptidase-like regulatory domain-containing protein [Bacteroidaceae bacterium]|nr:carboxypeptidase-like regulatory domain-containing protein [Bacteroidaceae bacterium]
MRKILFLLFCSVVSLAAFGQASRTVRGVVFDDKDIPLQGVTVSVVGSPDVSTLSDENGLFEMKVSPYAKYVEASMEGYITKSAEIDGTYLVFKLKIDKNYAKKKAKAEEEARIAAEKEAEAKAKAEAEERARIEAQREAQAKAEAEEKARIAAAMEAEAKAKAKAEEQARIAAEKEAAAKAKAEEQARIAAKKEAEAKAKAEEKARIAAQKEAEAKAKAKAEEEARIAARKEAEAKAKAEAEERARIAARKEAEAKAKAEAKAERDRIAKIEAEKIRKEYARKQSGFASMIDVSYRMPIGSDFSSNLGLSYTAGYRLNNAIYVGAGVGLNYFTNNKPLQLAVEAPQGVVLSPSAISIPVFAYFRANFINGRFSPFFALAAGYELAGKQTLHLDLYDVEYATSSFFVNPQLGINFRTTLTTSLYLAVGFQGYVTPCCPSHTGYNAHIKQVFTPGVDIHLGFTF